MRHKKGFLDDVLEIIYALIFISIIMISFISCQELKKTGIETQANQLMSDIEYQENLREFVRIDADLFYEKDYQAIKNNATNYFNDLQSGQWQLIIKENDNIIKKIPDTTYSCKNSNRLAIVRIPIKNGVSDIILNQDLAIDPRACTGSQVTSNREGIDYSLINKPQ